MPEFKVGTLKASGLESTLIFQSVSTNIESEESKVKDEDGNTAYVQHYDHKAVLTVEAVAAKDQAQPCKGATVAIKGVVLPTVNADGSMTSSTITLLSDASNGTPVDFLVETSNLVSSNSEVCKYSLTLTRYLENGIGAIKTSSGA